MSSAARSLDDAPVLVTGGAGFIGSHLVDALVARGERVRVLDDLSTGKRQNLAHHLEPPRGSGRGGTATPRSSPSGPGSDRPSEVDPRAVELVAGDIRDLETCRRAVEGTRVVFHQAALGSVPRSLETPAATFAINAGGTVNVFTAARDAGVERVVYASSSSVYGDSRRSPKREGEEGRTLSPYALSKAVTEETADVFARCFGLTLVGLRYFNVYGPRQDPEGPYAAVVPRFFRAALAGRPLVVFGDGEQSRDFTFVTDAVAANLLAAEAPVEGAVVANVAGGRAVSVNRLAAAVPAAAGLAADAVEVRHEAPRPGDVRHSLADLARAGDLLGYEPAVGLDEGLERTLDFYRKISR